MAQTIKRLSDGNETWDRNGNCTSAEIKYLVLNPTNKRTAITGVIAAAPTSYGANSELPFKEVRFDGFDAGGNVECTAIYAANGNAYQPDSGTDEEVPTMSFDCGSGTKHVVHALYQERVYPANESDDADCGIGWNGKLGSECEFAGVDIPTADMQEEWTKYVRVSALTTQYKKDVASLYGKYNNATFKGWAAGEVMFVGMSYSMPLKGQTKVLCRYTFRISPNESNATVSGHTVGAKLGWEYMWARSEAVNVAGQTKPAIEVAGIYKSGVTESGDFSLLGLGS